MAAAGAAIFGGVASCKSSDTMPEASTPLSTTSTATSPITSAIPAPTDVVEMRNGYEVLRNGLFHYSVPSIIVDDQQIELSGTGGIDLWVRTTTDHWMAFKPAPKDGPAPQSIVYRDLLRCFANQAHLDVPAFVAQASASNWVIQGLFPDNIGDVKTKYPPIAPVPVTIDFKQPFVIAAGKIDLVDGLDVYSGTYDYFILTSADNGRDFLAVSSAGQFMWCTQGGLKYDEESIGPDGIPVLSRLLGQMLSIVGSLGVAAENANDQLLGPMITYNAPSNKTPPTLPDPNPFKDTVMDVHDYKEWSWAEGWSRSKLFDEVDLKGARTA